MTHRTPLGDRHGRNAAGAGEQLLARLRRRDRMRDLRVQLRTATGDDRREALEELDNLAEEEAQAAR